MVEQVGTREASVSVRGASVVICCYTEARLGDTLEAATSARHQTVLPRETILVVDNNRLLYDRLRREADQSVRVVHHEGPRGVSGTRNAGVDLAQGDLVAFLDDDAVAEPGWLRHLTDPFRDPDVVAVGGKAVLHWARRRPPWFPEDLDWAVGGSPTWFPRERALVRNPHGFNMCFRRDVFKAVGGFATEIGGLGRVPRSGEEVDLCLRIRHRWPAAKVVWEPAAVVVHKVPEFKARFPVVMRRAYNEGLYKSWILHASPRDGNENALSSERAYLTYLLSRGFPSRLTSLQPRRLLEATALGLCIAAAGLGYAIGNVGHMSSFSQSRESKRRKF